MWEYGAINPTKDREIAETSLSLASGATKTDYLAIPNKTVLSFLVNVPQTVRLHVNASHDGSSYVEVFTKDISANVVTMFSIPAPYPNYELVLENTSSSDITSGTYIVFSSNVVPFNLIEMYNLLTANKNLKVSIEESSIKQPVDKQAIYRVQVIEDTTALGANDTYTSPSVDTSNYSKFQGFVASDQDGTLYIDKSSDGSNWVQIDSKSVTGSSANPPVGVPINEDVTAPYMRVRYVNGGTAQNSFRLEVYTAVP